MIKTSARRKLASNLLARGLRTLGTPVSQLSGKQKLLGALGAGGAIAGGKLLYSHVPELAEFVSKPLQSYQTNKALAEIAGYGQGLRAPVAESTREFLNSQVLGRGLAAEAKALQSKATGFRSAFKGLSDDLSSLQNSNTGYEGMLSDTSKFLDTQSKMLPGAQDRIARNYAGNILLRDYLDGSTFWAGLKDRIPGVGAYTGAQEAIKSLVRQEALLGTPEIRNYIKGLTDQDLSGFSGKFKSIAESREQLTKALEAQNTLRGDIFKAYGESERALSGIKDYGPKLTRLRDELVGVMGPSANYTLPQGSNIVGRLSELKGQMVAGSEAAGAVSRNLSSLQDRLRVAQEAKQSVLDAARNISQDSRRELSTLLDSAVSKANKDLEAYNLYVDKMNLGDEFSFAKNLSFSAPTAGGTAGAAAGAAADKLREAALNKAIAELAKKSVTKGAVGLAGSAANAALGVGTAMGGAINRFRADESTIKAILEQLNTRQVGNQNLDAITKLFQAQTNSRAEVATQKLMDEIRSMLAGGKG